MLLISCVQNEKSDLEPEWTQLEENNYSIYYPNDWNLNQAGQNETSFNITSPSTAISDPFSENVNLLIQDLTNLAIDLNKFIEISVNQVETVVKNGKMFLSKRKKAHGLEFQKVIYTGQYGDFDLKFKQYCWVRDDHAYILTFTSEEKQFDRFDSVSERILKSFKFTD